MAPRHAWLSLVVVLALAVVLSPAPAGAVTADGYERSARSATNLERVSRDRVALRQNRCVQRYADRQARRMARQERMFHQDLGVVVRRCGLSRAGENVGYGYPTSRAVVRAWMRSDGHRANILDRRYRLLGMGAARDAYGRWFTAQVFGRR